MRDPLDFKDFSTVCQQSFKSSSESDSPVDSGSGDDDDNSVPSTGGPKAAGAMSEEEAAAVLFRPEAEAAAALFWPEAVAEEAPRVLRDLLASAEVADVAVAILKARIALACNS